MPVEKPVSQFCLYLITCFSEQVNGRLVVCCHYGIQLVQMYYPQGIISQQRECCQRIAIATIVTHHDDSRLRALVLRVEAHQIADAHCLLRAYILYNKPHLPVCKNIVRRCSDIIVQCIARVRHVGRSHVPQATVVFQLIEQVEVLRFNGSEPDITFHDHRFLSLAG